MRSSIHTLAEILSSPSQYIIPVFQRNYRWDKAQWEKLWESIVDLQSSSKTGAHFMGFLVMVPGVPQPGMHTRFHLVDGQQRLTTSSILLVALRNVARTLDQNELANEINSQYIIHPFKKGIEHYRLLPKAKDQVNFTAIVNERQDASGRIADALDFFEEKIRAHGLHGADSLRGLYHVVCQRLAFMSATLEAENAYSIFKSLNSTGVPLGQADLIRNFVFMHVLPDEQEQFDADRWSRLEAKFLDSEAKLNDSAFSKFFRDVMMMDGRYVSPPGTFERFEAENEATAFAPVALLDKLLVHAAHYEAINGKRPDASQPVTAALSSLRELESSTTHPLLLSLFKLRVDGVLDDGRLSDCIGMLAGFIMRRFVCSESSRGYGQMFVRAIAAIQTIDPVVSLRTYLSERGWPDNDRFTRSFVNFPLYERGYTKIVLETLERAREHKEPAALAAAQIEHVMPQTLSAAWADDLGVEAKRIHAQWLHTPGNLTLSGYNQELFNHPFSRKSLEYEASNIVITRELAHAARWGEEEIRQRGELLASSATALWMGPPIAPPEVRHKTETETSEQGDAFRLRFWTGFADYQAEQHSSQAALNPRPAAALRLTSGIRNIGFNLKLQLRPSAVAIEIMFWREAAFPVWQSLQARIVELGQLTHGTWDFGRPADEANPRWMVTKLELSSLEEVHWQTAFEWLGNTLDSVFLHIAPLLRGDAAQSDEVPPSPPWLKFPEIPSGSIGWRMGSGEDYQAEWLAWFRAQPSDRQKAYVSQFSAPSDWNEFYAAAFS